MVKEALTTAPKTKSGLKLKASDFVHLHNHSHYSILDGLQKIPEMVAKVRELGMESVAITDHGSMAGAIDLYKTCQKEGIKPIIGQEFYVAARKHTDKDKNKDRQRYHLILLAMNDEGYRNLCRLSTIAWRDGDYFKPRIDHDLIQKYNEGLICLSSCIGGEVGDNLRSGNIDKARELAAWYKSVFGDRYYLEVQDHGHMWQEQQKVNEQLLKLSDELEIPAVVTCDAHYLTHADQDVHEILLCVNTGANIDDVNRFSLKSTDLYLTDPEAVIERWAEHPEVILNTKKIADRCNIEIKLGGILIPKFETPDGQSEKQYLEELVWQGLAWRYGDVSQDESLKLNVVAAKKKVSAEIIERAEFELSVIDSMGFNGYFLIVRDFIIWGKDQGIVFGPGRGSAAGSIISYSLRITDLDPLQYDLLFERFLNPDRISMPDIDIDIQDSRRAEVIQYCIEKYGADQVANIGTYGIMAARAAVRDVARVLAMPYAKADALAKLIPPPVQGRHIPLQKSLQSDAGLKMAYQDSENKRVLDIAVRLEGTIRNNGVHAAGVVIAPSEITDYAPLYKAPSGVMATQYAMGPVEELGLLKMDFLGLSNLTTINNAVRIIRKVYGEEIDVNNLSLADPETLDIFRRGDTTGLFQFESSGMRSYLKQLKPTEFNDLVAMSALYRPGPLSAGIVDKFIRRKNGEEEVQYDHPSFEVAYKDTFGVLVYQEQFMIFAREICGFSGGESDTLRKAVGKKKIEVLRPLEERYVSGGVEHSKVPVEIMQKSWKDLLGFADYCFNKSHSACYALIAYQTGYLKAHYPDAFMAALMTSDSDNIDRLTIEISECKNIGIKVMNPDVNESFPDFAIVKDQKTIRFGLGAIKNVGHGAAESIVAERQENGIFKDLEDFLGRIKSGVVNKKALESLIKSGALDSFGYTRKDLFDQIAALVSYSQKRDQEALSKQANLFGGGGDGGDFSKLNITKTDTDVEDYEKLDWERELLGLYLSSHPLEKYQSFLQDNVNEIKDLSPENSENKTISVGGTVSTFREITTKNGAKMAFVGVADMGAQLELVCFPEAYKKFETALKESNAVIVATGKISFKTRDGDIGEEPKMLLDELVDLRKMDSAAQHNFKKLKLKTTRNKDLVDSIDSLSGSDLSSVSFDSGQAESELKVQDIESIVPETATKNVTRSLYIKITKEDYSADLLKLKALADQQQGEVPVVLVFGQKPDQRALKMPFKINLPEVEADIIATFGEPNISY